MAVGGGRPTVRAVTEPGGAALPRRELRLAPRLPRWARDVLPAVAVAIVQVGVVMLAAHRQPEARPMTWWGVVLLALGPAALAFRRVAPVPVLIVTFVSTMAYWLTDLPRGPAFLALLIAYIVVAMRGRRRVAWASLGLGFVIVGLISPALHHERWPPWAAAAALAAWLIAVGTGTELLRARQQRIAEEAATRAEEARRRASDERLRIAQELHDVLAHNISLISVQAGVGLHLLDEHPEQARPALTAIREASADALGELRTVLDILRSGPGSDERAPLAPTAGLRDLDALVERARATGLDVVVESPPDESGDLPAGVDLAALRVAQEALTNVVRHSGAERAWVRVTRSPGELVVQVDDDGHGPAADAVDEGHGGRGSIGMRERTRALGGTLDAGPRPGRGFRVRARLPLPGADGDGDGGGGPA
jgi:signal transduction histidine kinase